MRMFIFGATGATGTVLVPMARAVGHDVPFHVRPQSAAKSVMAKHEDASIFELAAGEELRAALANADLVVSLIGTMRRRFATGDTYASSDVGTTRALVSGCESAGVPRFFLLSSYGAGGAGAYLRMKGECEGIVQASKLSWTVFRPSALVSPEATVVPTHGTRSRPPLISGAMKIVGRLPGMGDLANDVAPISIEVLCRAILNVASAGGAYDGRILAGRDLVPLGAK